MLNLKRYRDTSDHLADHLPWAALVADDVVLNKDGSFLRAVAFRGPDLESSTNGELVATAARVNNLLKRFGSGWALFFHAERREVAAYPESSFPDPASWLVDRERLASFEGGRDHFESHFHVSFVWMPPPDSEERARTWLVDKPDQRSGIDWREGLRQFSSDTDRAIDLLKSIVPFVEPLTGSALLTFLHDQISTKRHPVAVPETPTYLDALLADTSLVGGLEPRLGDQSLRTLTVQGLPAVTSPGLLDALNHLDIPYRWATRFIALDQPEAQRLLTRTRRQWFNKRKSVTALLREVMYNQPAQLLDSDADNKVVDADLALQELGQDFVSFGYLTTTLTVAAESEDTADQRLRLLERAINGLGFTTIRERLNAVEAWLSGLPGHLYANVRQPVIHSLNLAHLMPLSAVWAGPADNTHLGGPPLLLAQTSGSTPFRISTHIGDVGHMMVVGPTGAGKSVLLALLALQFRRYPGARIVLFDKGWSGRAAILAMGGQHHALGLAGDGGPSLQFQPLFRISEDAELAWAAEWVGNLLQHAGLDLNPELRQHLWSALSSLASAPPAERTLTGLALLLQSSELKAALEPFTLDGAFGGLLDADHDGLSIGDVHAFEMEWLMDRPQAVFPVLTYLFHRLEQQFDGRPTLLILDEAWLFLDDPLFAARIREWLKVLRKKNVAVVFATQSLSDVAASSIAPALIESCPQRIFLPNSSAAEPQSREAYERFGLNSRQVELIARATPKRDYYLQSRAGNRLFDLILDPIALSICGSSDPDSQRLIDQLVASGDPANFTRRFLDARSLGWAADVLDNFTLDPRQQGEDQ